MSSLAGKTLSSTFSSLLKLEGDSQTLSSGGSSAIQIKTGDNEATPLYLNTDRLGIGIASPEQVLDILGNIKLRQNYLEISNSNNNSSIFIKNSGSSGQDGIHIGRSTGTADIFIDNTGQVGIGNATPASQLHIGGTNPQIRIGDDDAEDTRLCFMGNAQDFYIALDDTTDDLTIGTGTTIGSNAKVVIENGGNVGIGTITPDNQLDIHSTGAQIAKIESDDNAASLILDAHTNFDGGVLFKEAGTSEWIIGCDGSDTNKFKVCEGGSIGTNDRVVVAEGGKVGIGTSAPDTKLHVAGSIAGMYVATTTAGPTDNLDVSNTFMVSCNTVSNNITIGGLAGGVAGQVLHIFKSHGNNNLILEHSEGGGSQDIYTLTAADETVVGYGGWTLVCDGTRWYTVSQPTGAPDAV